MNLRTLSGELAMKISLTCFGLGQALCLLRFLMFVRRRGLAQLNDMAAMRARCGKRRGKGG